MPVAAAPSEAAGRRAPAPPLKRRWHPPVLERLGPWRALTLQQSVGIGPSGFGLLSPDPGRPERLG